MVTNAGRPGLRHHDLNDSPFEMASMISSASCCGTGVGGRPSFLRGCDACPACGDLRSSGIIADPLDECAFEVEHAREASVSDAMVFVQVADLVDNLVWYGAVVVGLPDAISAFVECDENGFGFHFFRILRRIVGHILWVSCLWNSLATAWGIPALRANSLECAAAAMKRACFLEVLGMRVLWGCGWDKNNAPPDLWVYGGALPGDLCDESSARIA